MLRAIKYGAISGKSRAMYGKLLKQDDYTTLIHKKSVSEVISYLKNDTHYQSALSDIDERTVHRVQLERILRCELNKDYDKLLKFSDRNLRSFINMLYSKIEIEDIKIIFRLFEAGHAQELNFENLSSTCATMNNTKLALCKNLKDFLSCLKGTEYYGVLKPFISDSNKTRLFDVEMALDRFYLINLQKNYMKFFMEEDRNIVKEFIGLESDIFNIYMIYRYKSFYNMDDQVVKSYTLPLIYKLSKKTTEALVKGKDIEEFLSIIRGTCYGFLFDSKNVLSIDYNHSEIMYKTYKLRFRKYPFSIAGVISYLRIKEMELSNIITIIEGIRYQLSEADIRKYIVGI